MKETGHHGRSTLANCDYASTAMEWNKLEGQQKDRTGQKQLFDN
jgi:hypothetical protein